MRKSGWLRFFSVWTALVVTECAPEHHAREKSHGSLITYKLVVMFLSAYFL